MGPIPPFLDTPIPALESVGHLAQQKRLGRCLLSDLVRAAPLLTAPSPLPIGPQGEQGKFLSFGAGGRGTALGVGGWKTQGNPGGRDPGGEGGQAALH